MFFFPIPDKLNSQFDKTKKKYFFFWGGWGGGERGRGSPSLFHIIQILTIKLNCLITNNQIIYQEKR